MLLGKFKLLILEKIHRKHSLWKAENEKLQENIEKYVSHPINAFKLIKRLTVDIDEFYIGGILKAIKTFEIATKELKPASDDLVGAIDGLLRLQKMYNLQTDDIANGIIDGHASDNKLSKHDLLTIAKIALTLEDEAFYVREYLEKALEADDPMLEVNHQEIVDVHEKSKRNENLAKPFVDDFVKNGVYTKEKEFILYSRLCRQQGTKTPAERARLKCFYDSKSDFSKIAPFKVEEADHRINLVIFHDVIFDSEIDELKRISRSNFVRGTVVQGNLTKIKSRGRTAKITWFPDKSHEIVGRISKRVEVCFFEKKKIFSKIVGNSRI